MESQPQNPEFRNNPENFHPYTSRQRVNPDLIVPGGKYQKSLGKQCRPGLDCSNEQSGLCQHCLLLSNHLITCR